MGAIEIPILLQLHFRHKLELSFQPLLYILLGPTPCMQGANACLI